MASTAILVMIAGILGGLTFFLFGMSTMSGGLEQMAGGSLERTMKKVTSNDFAGFALGAGITIAIQSSSAMTVMLVGLVNSGIMAFADTFGMIMGTHVGTTLTAWITTLSGISGNKSFFMTLLNPATFAPILAFVGIAMKMFSKNERKKTLGIIFIGFAILMAGMGMMSEAVSSAKDNPAFIKMLTAFKSPIVALLVSTVFTGIIQSSAATVVIVQSLALTGTVSYQIAIPLIVGANIGTCMTALISCIGTNKEAKRVVAMHIYTNAIGGILCIILMYIVMAVNPSLMASHTIGVVGVAVVHSLFNIANTIFFIPFKTPLLKLCRLSVKRDDSETHTVFLDERVFNNSPLAISECRRLVDEMAKITEASVYDALSLLDNYDETVAARVVESEKTVDKYEDRLGEYLVRISANKLGTKESYIIARMIHSLGDFERISDHALNLSESANEIKTKKILFSADGSNDIFVMTKALKEIVKLTFESFALDDVSIAGEVEPLEQVIDKLKDIIKARHVKRLQSGDCTMQMGFVLNDLLTNFERISDHCSNIAVYTLQLNTRELEQHSFLGSFKSGNNEAFENRFKYYEDMFSIE